jgi:hypothetical protein
MPDAGKAVSSPSTIDFTELDRLVPEELKDTKTPGAQQEWRDDEKNPG